MSLSFKTETSIIIPKKVLDHLYNNNNNQQTSTTKLLNNLNKQVCMYV
jgi:hypothetical protein